MNQPSNEVVSADNSSISQVQEPAPDLTLSGLKDHRLEECSDQLSPTIRTILPFQSGNFVSSKVCNSDTFSSVTEDHVRRKHDPTVCNGGQNGMPKITLAPGIGSSLLRKVSKSLKSSKSEGDLRAAKLRGKMGTHCIASPNGHVAKENAEFYSVHGRNSAQPSLQDRVTVLTSNFESCDLINDVSSTACSTGQRGAGFLPKADAHFKVVNGLGAPNKGASQNRFGSEKQTTPALPHGQDQRVVQMGLRKKVSKCHNKTIPVPASRDSLLSAAIMDGTKRTRSRHTHESVHGSPGQDVSHYGLRTSWQGLRHNDIHDAPVSHKISGHEPEGEDDESTEAQPSTSPERKPGMKRTLTCPQSFNRVLSKAVKPDACKRNHRNFHDVYTLGKVLGTGGFAVVRECVHKQTGEHYAVKLMTVSADGVNAKAREVTHKMMMGELQMMTRLDHPNIIHLKEYFFSKSVCCIVMQLLEGVDLMDQLDESGHSQADVKVVMRSLLDAISHMHDHRISHRDLKLENLVLARPGDLGSVTIVDFGLAKAARARQQMKGVVGTTEYCAPEILMGRPYTPVVDSWSLGVVMYLMLTGEYPFEDPDEDALEDSIIDDEPDWSLAQWQDTDPEAIDLVKGLLRKDPLTRLTPGEALEHAWITGHGHTDSATLKHVHKRLDIIRQNGNLEIRTFEPGQWLVRQGERVRSANESLSLAASSHTTTPRFSPATSRLPSASNSLNTTFNNIMNHSNGTRNDRDSPPRHPSSIPPTAPLSATLPTVLHNTPHRLPSNHTSHSGTLSTPLAYSHSITAPIYHDHVECYLIISGEAEVLLHVPGKSTSPSESLRMGMRRPGNFVGAISVQHDDLQRPASFMRSTSSIGQRSRCNSDSLASSHGSLGFGSPRHVWSFDAPMASIRKSFGGSLTSTISQASDDVGVDSKEWTSRGVSQDPAGLALRVVLMCLRVKHRWVGRRRALSVRAVTPLSVLVVSHEDMKWAVAHDFRLCGELSAALKKRRLVIKDLETVVRGKGKVPVAPSAS